MGYLVSGDALANSHQCAELAGKEGFTTCPMCEALEHSWIGVLVVFGEKTDSEDGSIMVARMRV